MDIIQLLPLIYSKFIIYTLIFTRISALLTTFVLFRRDLITGRMIISLSALLSIMILLLNQQWQVQYDLFSISMVTHALFQSLIGIVTGIFLNIVFEVFVAIGQITSTQIGLSTASLIDPRFGYITSLTHFYVITMTLIFLYMNGHLYAIKALADSFNVIPINQEFFPTSLLTQIISYSGIIFKGAITLTITIIVVLLLTNIALAIMTKFAPQFNLFSIGLNMQMVMGLFFIYITYRLYINGSSEMISSALNYLQTHLIKSS